MSSILSSPRPPQIAAPSGSIQLRDYQREALDTIAAAAGRGIRRQLVVLPTGTGKTVIFSELIRRRGGQALVLAHRDELIEQAAAKLRLIAPAAPLGIVKAERDECAAAIVLASVQTLTRTRRLERMPTDLATVVIDEAHHSPADSYRRILDHVRAGTPDGPLLGNELIAPKTALRGPGPRRCRERLGGVLKFYYREAA
jgi:ATP-dependent helicase IRC3